MPVLRRRSQRADDVIAPLVGVRWSKYVYFEVGHLR